MKKILLLFTIFSLAFFSSCIKDVDDTFIPNPDDNDGLELEAETLHHGKIPTSELLADFILETTNGTTDEKVTLDLTNTSKGAVSYEWDFGNGDTSTDETPEYHYDIHGNYTITLKVAGANGEISERSQEIVVLCIYGGGDHNF